MGLKKESDISLWNLMMIQRSKSSDSLTEDFPLCSPKQACAKAGGLRFQEVLLAVLETISARDLG